MAAGGERNLESNQFAIDVSLLALYLRGTKISCLLQAIYEGGFYLPAYLYIYILSLPLPTLKFKEINAYLSYISFLMF